MLSLAPRQDAIARSCLRQLRSSSNRGTRREPAINAVENDRRVKDLRLEAYEAVKVGRERGEMMRADRECHASS
jgi:hypothetical protein